MMEQEKRRLTVYDRVFSRLNWSVRKKLIVTLVVVKIIPILLLTVIAFQQIGALGTLLQQMAVEDSSEALNDSATENIERMTTDTAARVAAFLYERDDDLLFLAGQTPSEELYRGFIQSKTGAIIQSGEWVISEDGSRWEPVSGVQEVWADGASVSSNTENNDMDGFHYRLPDAFEAVDVPLYDEITFVGLDGVERIKVVADDSTKVNYPMTARRLDVSDQENTYVKAETYWDALQNMEPGEIYVSDVIGAYVGSNYIGMYTPDVVAAAAKSKGYDIEYDAETQAYSGQENPVGQRFEGIVRFATPVADANGNKIGYLTFALNHDHIMEFVDHQTPMNERYTDLPSAFDGNYAFIWDYKCRSICHPRHHSIVGYNPETGEEQIPWLESSIYEAWLASGTERWSDWAAENVTEFDNQSRTKAPAAALTQAGMVGLDGRYLNNAPQCTGWMDLSADGGSGSFYILWSGLYKLTTAAAIPYYTGQYAPSEENGYSLRGFGVVTIGAGLEDFTRPAAETELRLEDAKAESLDKTMKQLAFISAFFIVLVVAIAIWIASSITNNITYLVGGISRFRSGQRQFRFHTTQTDEFGTLADSFDDMADSIEESVRNPLAITDLNRTVIYMNSHGLEITNKTLMEIVGTNYSDSSVYPANTEYDPIAALEEGRESSVVFIPETGRYYRGVANYFTTPEGERQGYIVESLDVTELEVALKLANEASAHKGDFLARMSHEIRTPMNAIIGLTTLAGQKLEEHTEKPGEVESYIRQIDASSQHLLGLINDILDISKIEAGKIELDKQAMDLEKLFCTVESIITRRCEDKNITFKTSFAAVGPAVYLGDPLRLRQVLINLLGNAVKFTPEHGIIHFSIESLEEEEGRSLLRFSVKDTGIGVAEEAQSGIFDAFEQADNKVFRRYGGTGLGLSISQSMVQLMGGTIELESTLGEGSDFYFDIWLPRADASALEEDFVVDLTGRLADKRILLVDDVDINRMIVVSMLEATGVSIDEAVDGQNAVDTFAASPVNTYDLVLMDIQMPNLDGYEASAAIRHLDRPDGQSVPIIALTANAFQEDIAKALESGMNAYLAKPVEMKMLHERIAQALGL